MFLDLLIESSIDRKIIATTHVRKIYCKHNIWYALQKYLQPLKSPENAGLVDAGTVDEIFYQVKRSCHLNINFCSEKIVLRKT